jgi:site-specific DNA-cytosine methylase
MPLKAIDFFSDGGVTCGFKQVGIEVIGGIDIDPACKETYERNNRAKYLCADVSNLNVKRLIDGGIVNAKYYGVPQNRKWYMLVATRVKHKIALPIGDKNNIYTVKDAIGDKNKFKPIEQGQSDSTSFMHSSARLSNIDLLRIKNTMHDGGSRETWPKISGPNVILITMVIQTFTEECIGTNLHQP